MVVAVWTFAQVLGLPAQGCHLLIQRSRFLPSAQATFHTSSPAALTTLRLHLVAAPGDGAAAVLLRSLDFVPVLCKVGPAARLLLLPLVVAAVWLGLRGPSALALFGDCHWHDERMHQGKQEVQQQERMQLPCLTAVRVPSIVCRQHLWPGPPKRGACTA
jgi:hypothetical protein